MAEAPWDCVAAGEIDSFEDDTDGSRKDVYIERIHNAGADLFGRLLPCGDSTFAHVNCLRSCPEVVEMTGLLHNASDAKTRGSTVFCYLCNKSGATIGCSNRICRRSFHLKCALLIKGELGIRTTLLMYDNVFIFHEVAT